MSSIATGFLKKIGEECFGTTDRDTKRREKACFSLRFHPSLYLKNHPYIAEAMKKELGEGNYESAINTTVSNVVEAIVKTYQEEMKESQLDTDSLTNRGRGQQGAWKEVYDWLWNDKFSRWCRERYPNSGEDWFLDCLSENARNEGTWIEVRDRRMNRIAGGKRRQDKQIQVNTSCSLQINLDYPNYHFLLLNRCDGEITSLCPSLDFAPRSSIEPDQPIIIPQSNAEYEDLIFEKVGKEEFIAIVVNSPLVDNHLSVGNLHRFWLQSLQEGRDLQVFYDRFEVVNE